ncbi:MAG TPA: S8 family serine peptidase [Gaiellaceae bacterium]|nr:S8 family serine peptidase [Gaiellaceae bacterium]
MGRLAFVALLAALLAFSGTAAASLGPTPRSVVEQALAKTRTTPEFQRGAIRAAGPPHARVIVTLNEPPLAAAANARRLAGLGPNVKLNVASSFSRSYVTSLQAAQARAIAQVRTAIPEAVVSRRYHVLLNGFAVSVPYERLPELLELDGIRRVYPSLSYTMSLNKGPSVIGATQFAALTGALGAGVKVAVVDDGVDHEHPFLRPGGLSYPAGFPKGPGGGTTPKVVAARGFAGPGGTGAPLDRDRSFHGTHVAGIIAGVETDVPAGVTGVCVEAQGGCHPAVSGLRGVAPRAHIGNYRVFNVPLPLGGCCSANTPEIVAAFEAAVRDGMDVINFSGGGPQADPRTDGLIEAVTNIVRAGVVPVVSAGNDRDFFGLGTAGSPATAPDAISVGSVVNSHVFGASLAVSSPAGLPRMAFVASERVPPTWISADQRLVDVGSLAGVSRLLCGGGAALPANALRGAIALVSRGGCPHAAKAQRAREAGAIGLVVAENRPGDPGFAILSGFPGGAISDLDGARLRAAMAGNGGAATVRFNRTTLEVDTTWAGVPSSFSAGGLTPFGHALKPDVTAPGSQILSSTLREFAGDLYAILDGTSFSAPHVAGAVAQLLERHPTWTPAQVKSALMSTAGPAFGDSARTEEASVLVQGAGLVQVGAADRPLIFTSPQSLSFGYLSVLGGAASRSVSVAVSDAGDGAGTWTAEIQPQVASSGATVEAASVTIAPGGTAVVQMVARATAGATAGDNFGFVALRRGDAVRRIPYAFSVTRSGLTGAPVTPLRATQTGDTRTGEDRARVYRWPTSPFSVLGVFGVDPSVLDDGREKVYSLDIQRQAVNAGVVVTRPAPRVDVSVQSLLSSNAPIHPWFLGALDENFVLGYAGIPVNVNGLMPDFLYSIGASGGVFLPPGRYYVAVDSGRDLFTGRSLAGPYTLRSWVNDVRPPVVRLVTRTISSGRPTIVVRVTDARSGVDPLSLQLQFGSQLSLSVPATLFDPATGIAAFSLPRDERPLQPGLQFMRVVASDFQEAKNINTETDSPMPNTRFFGIRMPAVSRPTVHWVLPTRNGCVGQRQRLLVVANDNVPISSVGFFAGNRQIARVRRNVAGLYETTWRTSGLRRGTYVLRATASDTRGREAEATVQVRVCR